MDIEGGQMTKKLKSTDVKYMIARAVTAKSTAVEKRLDAAEELLKDIQATLKAITARLNVSPENPVFDALNTGLKTDPIHEAFVEKFPAFAAANPLIYPDNRKAIERVFAKRGWHDGDTVEKVLEEAKSL